MSQISVGSVTSKGQVTIPKEIRQALGIKEGDKVIFLVQGKQAVIKKVPAERLSDILSRHKRSPEDSLAFQKRMREEWQSKQSSTQISS